MKLRNHWQERLRTCKAPVKVCSAMKRVIIHRLISKPGNYVVTVTYTGYSRFTEPVKVNGAQTLDVRMQVGSGNTLNEVVVSSAGRKVTNVTHSTEKAIIAEIKNAHAVVSGISAQQISMSADRNAAEVIQRVSGITVMDDKFVVVQGMNQRYNLTLISTTM